MSLTVDKFIEDYEGMFESIYAFTYEEGSIEQQYHALGRLVRKYLAKDWSNTRSMYLDRKAKQVYYFSMEFLPGTQLTNNMYNMGLFDTVHEGLEKLGLDPEKVERAEPDPALGNGGLGRLASCFMDSLASLGIPGNGKGTLWR